MMRWKRAVEDGERWRDRHGFSAPTKGKESAPGELRCSDRERRRKN